MSADPVRIRYSDFPLASCSGDSVLAVITLTDGPSYRAVGAGMVVRDGKVIAGTLSSGCIERDVARHAQDLRGVTTLRYGSGSPFFDIQLPCGGGLEVTLVPCPPAEVAERIAEARRTRRTCPVAIGPQGLTLGGSAAILNMELEPDLAFHVFGKGPEARIFAEMAHAAGFDVGLTSHDAETLDGTHVRTAFVGKGAIPDPEAFDAFSAVVLFYHDHDLEPPILAAAVQSPAFYVGAQGSRRARERRDEALRSIGVVENRIARIKGPIGLLHRARDARTLAISVLAEVIEAAR